MNMPQSKPPHFDIDPGLLSFISHHVRGQYNGLLGFAELLNQNYFRLSDDERLEYIIQVNFLAKKAFVNVENMILWLKILSNNLSPNVIPLRAADIVDHCMNMCNDEADSMDVDLLKEFDDKISVKTDRILVSSILTNLISNAVKSSKAGDKITISCGTQKGSFFFEVQDQAPAIRNEYISTYFGTPPAKREKPYDIKSGLGLWVSNELATLMGGSILLENQQESGKKFRLLLP